MIAPTTDVFQTGPYNQAQSLPGIDMQGEGELLFFYKSFTFTSCPHLYKELYMRLIDLLMSCR